jgi:hypothetical protein
MIDTNKEMVNLARESGIECVSGNALRRKSWPKPTRND